MLITSKSSICIMKHVAEKEGAIFFITFFLVTGSQEWSVKPGKTHSLLRQDRPFIKECYSFYRFFGNKCKYSYYSVGVRGSSY